MKKVSGLLSKMEVRSSRLLSFFPRFTIPDLPFTIHHSRFTIDDSRFTIHHSLFTAFIFALFLVLLAPFSAFGTDKLIVKDANGNAKFVVTDSGFIGAGMDNPLYNYDLSGQGVSKSSMHFSLNGTDVGGWITSILDNNFWLSSGSAYDPSLGGWVQKSADGKSVMAGSGGVGYRIFTQSGAAVGSLVTTNTRLLIDYSGNIGIGTSSPTQKLDVNDNGIRIEQSMTPASSTATCNQGQIAWDANYVYVCVAANTWKRSALASW